MCSETVLKWKLPGWRIESRYNNHVLIGNWNEECRNFERGQSHYKSTSRTDYKNYGNIEPDTKQRRESLIRNDGVGKQYIICHDKSDNKGNHISWYDQHYNGRELQESKLPPLRKWDGNVLAYVPEKSDFPIQGKPTNYGLHESFLKKWKQQEVQEKDSHFATTYKVSFSNQQLAPMATQQLKSTPQQWSSKLHPHQVNKNLLLRDGQCNTPPERLVFLT